MPLPITAETTEFITLAEVKAHANIPTSDTSHDSELALFQGTAQEHVESLIGPVLHQSMTESVKAFNGTVVLSKAPVVSVESFTSSGVAVTDYTLSKGSGLLTGVTASGDLSVSYTAGRASAPDTVRTATLIIAEHLWKTQLGNQPTTGVYPAEDELNVSAGFGYAIPNRALELLRPYMLAPAVA